MRFDLSTRSLLAGHLLAPLALAGLGLLIGASLACFSAPDDPVIFSCEPEGDDRCPPGYSCEVDGCCHREGSDVEAELGACALGGTPPETGSDTGSDTETETGSDTETG